MFGGVCFHLAVTGVGQAAIVQRLMHILQQAELGEPGVGHDKGTFHAQLAAKVGEALQAAGFADDAGTTLEEEVLHGLGSFILDDVRNARPSVVLAQLPVFSSKVVRNRPGWQW